MIKTCTPHDVIRYHFNETHTHENSVIEVALMTSSSLHAIAAELTNTEQVMEEILLQPTKSTVDSILQYAERMCRKHIA